MKLFKNIKEAHYYYKFPGSYRVGTIIYNNNVKRLYSNGTKGDYFDNDGKFYYILKNKKIQDAYLSTKNNKKKVYLFTKSNDGVIYHGKYNVIGFKNNKYVILGK